MHARTPVEAGPAPALATALSRLRQVPVTCLVTTDVEGPLLPSLAAQAIHHVAPEESSAAIQRFLDHWRPDVAVEMGVTDRPKLFTAAARRKVPLYHVAPSREAAGSRRRYPDYMGAFRACLAVSASEAQALRRSLGGTGAHIEITGPLCDTILAQRCNQAECDTLALLLGGRPVWLAAQVRAHETGVIEAAHRKAFRAAHRLLLIVAPADLSEAIEIRARFEAGNWRTSLRSAGGEPDPEVQVYVADGEDEMGLWYRLAPASYIGGTLSDGPPLADPFDPAALGSAVLHGPAIGQATSRFDRLRAAGAVMRVDSPDALGEAVVTLLAPDKAASLAQAGWAVTTESAHVVEWLTEDIDATLDGEAPK